MIMGFCIFICSGLLMLFFINYALLNELNEQIKLSLLVLMMFFSVILSVRIFRQKRFMRSLFYKIATLAEEKPFQNSPQTQLEHIKEKLDHQAYLLKKDSFKQENSLFLFEELYYHLGNIESALYLIENENFKDSFHLILGALHKQKEKLRPAINHPISYNKSIGGHSGKINHFNACVAVVNNDMLENFLLQNLLKHFGLQVVFFKQMGFDRNDYQLIFIKDEIYIELDKKYEDCIVFGRHQNLQYAYFLSLPLDKKALELVLSERLKQCELKNKIPYAYNVLLFKQSDFEANLYFNIIEKQCPQNTLVHSLTHLKECLKSGGYRLVLLDFEVIKYDLEQMKRVLNLYKSNYPQSHIVIFAKDEEKICNFDCISEVLSAVSKSELVALLRKYLKSN